MKKQEIEKTPNSLMLIAKRLIKSELIEIKRFLVYSIFLSVLTALITILFTWLSGGMDKITQNVKYLYLLLALYGSYRILLVLTSKYMGVASLYTIMTHKIKSKLLIELIILVDFIVTFITFLILMKLFTLILCLESQSEYDIATYILGMLFLPLMTYLSYRIIGIIKIKLFTGALTHE